MFKLKDKTFTLKEVENAALESDLNLEEYVAEVGLEEEDEEVKTNGVVETDASVTPEEDPASNTDLALDPTSSEFTRENNTPGINYESKVRQINLLENDPEVKDLHDDFNIAIGLNEEEKALFSRVENEDGSLGEYNDPVDFEPYEETTFKTNYKKRNYPKENVTVTIFPFEKELKQAEDILKKENPNEEPNAEVVKDLASRIVKDQQRTALIRSKTQDYLQTLTNAQRKSLKPYQAGIYLKNKQEFDTLNEQQEVIISKYEKSTNLYNYRNIAKSFKDPNFEYDLTGLGDIELVETLKQRIDDLGDPEYFFTEATGSLYNNLVENYNLEIKKIKTVKLKNGKIVPRATWDLFKDLSEENNQVLNTIQEIESEKDGLPLKVSDTKNLLNYLELNYSEVDKSLERLWNTFTTLPGVLLSGALGVASDTTSAIVELGEYNGIVPKGAAEFLNTNNIGTLGQATAFREYMDDWVEDNEKGVREKYVQDLTLKEGFSSVTNVGKFAAQEFIGQAGTIFMLAAGGYGLGMTGVGLDSYQNQIRVMKNEDKQLGAEKTSYLEKLAVSTGFAALEVTLGAIPTLKILNKGFGSLAADFAEGGTRKLLEVGIGTYGINGAKAFGWGAAMESPTEGGTVFFQNGIDIIRGVKTNDQILDNVPHAMVVGGMLGSTMSVAPVVAGMALNVFSDYNSYSGFRGNLNEIKALEVSANGLDKKKAPYKAIKKQIEALQEDNNNILDALDAKIASNLTKEGYYLFQSATKAQEELRIQAQGILSDKDMSKKQQQQVLKPIYDQFQALQQARNDFKISFDVNINLLSKQDQKKYKEKARLKLEKTGEVYTKKDLNLEAEKIWQTETFDKNAANDIKLIRKFNKAGIETKYNMAADNNQAISLFEEAIMARAADPNNKMTEAQAKKMIKEFKEGTNNGTLNGSNLLTFTKDGKRVYDIIINRANALANGKTLTGVHEIGHTLFAETISTNSDAFEFIAKDVLGWLNVNNKKAYTRIISRVKDQSNWDEVLTEFLEEVPRMTLEANNNKGLIAMISQGLPGAINTATDGKSKFNLKGNIDTIEFLNTLSTKLSSGKLTPREIRRLKKGVNLENTIDLIQENTDAKVSESKTPATVLATEAVELNGFKNLSAPKQQDLRNQYNSIAEKALGFIAGKGIEGKPKITKKDVISFVAPEMDGIINRFKPGKGNQFSTFVDSNIRPKRQAFYQQELKGKAVETRLSDERARQVESTETADSNIILEERARSEAKTDTKRIDVLNFKRAKDKVQELTKAVKLTAVDIASGLTFKNISDRFSGLVGEIIYDIPADRITTNRTLNYSDTVVDGIPVPSEASKIQSKFNNEQEVRNFLKILPPENVSQDTAVVGEQGVIKDVSREFQGISLGLKGRVLNYFYEKTGKRSGGLTSQPGVWKIKPQFINPTDATITKLQRDMGITGRGELNIPVKAKARTEFGTFIKGIAKLDSALIALRLATQAIETSPVKTAKPKQQIVADASAGKNRLMFSQTNSRIGDLIDSIDNPNFDIDKSIDKILSRNGIKPTFKFKTTGDVDIYIENLKKFVLPLMPRDFWFGKSGGTEFTPGIRSKSSWFKLYNDYYKPQMEALNGLPDSAFGKPVYITKIDPKTKKSVQIEVDYKRSAYSTIFKNPAIIRKNVKNGKIKEYNEKVGAIHKALWDRINTTIRGDKTKEAARGISNYLKLTGSQSNHWHKAGAEFVGFSIDPIGKVNKKGIKTFYEYEHAMPATAAYMYLIDTSLHSDYNFDTAYRAVMDNYKLIALDKAQNDKLNTAKLGRGMPKGWRLGENTWWQRYFNKKVGAIEGGINPESIEFTNGRTFADQLNIDSEGQRTTPVLRNSVSKAKDFNEKLLPNNIKFVKSDTNNNVIREMERLDNEAQEARLSFSKSKDLNKDFNKIIEKSTNIGREKTYGTTKARAVGAGKGRFDLLGIPPSAQDFVGLTRYFAGKGEQGNATIAWIKENFLDPFARANIDISNARVALANDFKGLKKLLNIGPKDLNKKITGEPYTVGNALRVYTWTQQGMNVPGLSKADAKILNDYVAADENLMTFADQLVAINKDNGYPKPQDGWLAGTITTDLLSGLNTVVRAKYLKQWQENVDQVFTEENMNKLEAAYGRGYRDALDNILGRMKTGSNRGFKGDSLAGRFTDWINGSVGAIMFFNMKSAMLQTISAINFINWSDNNPAKAALAFGNQPQYWTDVIKLMNSDYLVERRNGLKINVNEADIAEIAAESKNKAKAFISKVLKLGFLPTQIADSFAIASGGATFYRNRVKSYTKQGLSQVDAEAQAFMDFREISEESQQSSRPDRISAQQAGPLGRIILAFANTPAQYARLMQKAASDLKNRRGDDKTNVSKIIYYGMIQNVIFNALQQALFAMAFDDEEASDETKDKKYTEIVNGMSDSLLRGFGFHGAAVSTLKNVILKLAQGAKAQDAVMELLKISPPISSKIGKLKSAGRTWDWNQKEIKEKGWSLDNPAWLASGRVVSAATNVPLDRGIIKLQNLKDASDAENEEWQRVANALGWSKWQLDWEKDKEQKKGKSTGRTNKRVNLRTNKRVNLRTKKR